MRFTIEETGKNFSIAVIEKETRQDLLPAIEGLLNEHDNGVDINKLPIKNGRVVIKEQYIPDILECAYALLGDSDECYIMKRGI